MKKLKIVGVIIVVFGLAIAAAVWNSRDVSYVVPAGPFIADFSGSLYPPRPEAIEDWFRKTIPRGSSREDATRILAPSFSTDLTSGREVVIDSYSSWAGGEWTKVTLFFNERGFQNAHVKQSWAYL